MWTVGFNRKNEYLREEKHTKKICVPILFIYVFESWQLLAAPDRVGMKAKKCYFAALDENLLWKLAFHIASITFIAKENFLCKASCVFHIELWSNHGLAQFTSIRQKDREVEGKMWGGATENGSRIYNRRSSAVGKSQCPFLLREKKNQRDGDWLPWEAARLSAAQVICNHPLPLIGVLCYPIVA